MTFRGDFAWLQKADSTGGDAPGRDRGQIEPDHPPQAAVGRSLGEIGRGVGGLTSLTSPLGAVMCGAATPPDVGCGFRR